MSLTASRGRLAALTKNLAGKWYETKDKWRDNKANEFERVYVHSNILLNFLSCKLLIFSSGSVSRTGFQYGDGFKLSLLCLLPAPNFFETQVRVKGFTRNRSGSHRLLQWHAI